MSTRLPETAGKLTTPETITIVTHCIENKGSLPNLQSPISGKFFNLKIFNTFVSATVLSALCF
jgi:hypothetical protein